VNGGWLESVPQDAISNVVLWITILGGCAMHGHDKEALKHFEQMCEDGIELNDIIFISLLLAHDHVGLADEGMSCYVKL
jgi:pentatricopeptide repeat protein